MTVVNREFKVIVNDTERMGKAIELNADVHVGDVLSKVQARNWSGRTFIIEHGDEGVLTLHSVVGKDVTVFKRPLKDVPVAWVPAQDECVVIYPPASVTGRTQTAHKPMRADKPVSVPKPVHTAAQRPVIITVAVKGASWQVSYTATDASGKPVGQTKAGKVDVSTVKAGQQAVLAAVKEALTVWQPKPHFKASLSVSDTNVRHMLAGEMQSKANAALLAEVRALAAERSVTLE